MHAVALLEAVGKDSLRKTLSEASPIAQVPSVRMTTNRSRICRRRIQALEAALRSRDAQATRTIARCADMDNRNQERMTAMESQLADAG